MMGGYKTTDGTVLHQEQGSVTRREDHLQNLQVSTSAAGCEVRSQPIYSFVKRAFDIIFSLAVFLTLSLPMALVALCICLDDPQAPPIFAQLRVGKNGKLFKIYKFRSMVANAEDLKDSLYAKNEMDGPVFKIKDDPRITRIGRFIRKTCIDELPQFFNVLRGDMSIVGPRPPLPQEVEQYTAYQRQRLSVTPGLTCYWQVQPCRNSLSFEEWVELDLRYIRERSLLTDGKIIFQTVGAVLRLNGE